MNNEYNKWYTKDDIPDFDTEEILCISEIGFCRMPRLTIGTWKSTSQIFIIEDVEDAKHLLLQWQRIQIPAQYKSLIEK